MRSTHSPPPPPRASRTARNRVTLTRSVGTYESSDSSAVHLELGSGFGWLGLGFGLGFALGFGLGFGLALGAHVQGGAQLTEAVPMVFLLVRVRVRVGVKVGLRGRVGVGVEVRVGVRLSVRARGYQLWRKPSCATVVFAPLTSRTLRSTQLLAAAERSAGLRPPTNVKPLPPTTASLNASLRRQCAAAGHAGDFAGQCPAPALDDGPCLGLKLGLG